MNTIDTAVGYLIGLDLGERNDYTAVSLLRQHAVPTVACRGLLRWYRDRRNDTASRHLAGRHRRSRHRQEPISLRL